MDIRPKSSQSRSPASYPRFEPHITLASGLPASLSPAAILAAVPPRPRGAALPVRFESLEAGDTYFRSVFLAVHPAPALLALRDHIHGALRARPGVHPASPRFPHMSLCYIDDAEAGERRAAVDALVGSGRAVVRAGEGVAVDGLSGYDGAEIWVVRCEGPVEQWATLGKMMY